MAEDSGTKLYDQFRLKARTERIPISGVFELTPRCTLDCKMCYVHLTKAQMGARKELTDDQWIKIMDDAVARGMMNVQLTGGECLLHPGFREIYTALKKHPVVTSVNTNATLLDENYVEFFLKNPPNKLMISLYGSTEDGYERVTGVRACERVKENVLRAKNAGLSVKLNITVSRYMYDETEDIIRFALENHIPYGLDMNLVQPNRDTGKNLDDFNLTPDEIVEKYRSIRRMKGRDCIPKSESVEIPPLDLSGNEIKGMKCAAGASKFMVHWDGSFAQCFTESLPGVNIVDVGFDKAWELIGQKASEYARPIECETCRFLPICSECPFIREDPDNKGHRNEAVCKATIGKYLAGILNLEASN